MFRSSRSVQSSDPHTTTVRVLVCAEDVRRQLLAQIHLRLAVVGRVHLVLDDVELEVVERAAHVVEAVLRLDHHFVEARRVRPRFRSPR